MAVIGRAFVAITPPDDVLDAIEHTVSPVRRSSAGKKLRWAGRDQWHITLQFLGRVADGDLVGDAVHEAVSRIAPFGAQFGGAGAFPSVANANVLWAGVGEGQSATESLAQTVEQALVPLGYAAERREFHPHLTLARVNPPGDVAAQVNALDQVIGPSWQVGEVVLMYSLTRSAGAEYGVVARSALTGVAGNT
jgi:RNA 2',3'-cyclic 3'-phosphodiesterase